MSDQSPLKVHFAPKAEAGSHSWAVKFVFDEDIDLNEAAEHLNEAVRTYDDWFFVGEDDPDATFVERSSLRAEENGIKLVLTDGFGESAELIRQALDSLNGHGLPPSQIKLYNWQEDFTAMASVEAGLSPIDLGEAFGRERDQWGSFFPVGTKDGRDFYAVFSACENDVDPRYARLEDLNPTF